MGLPGAVPHPEPPSGVASAGDGDVLLSRRVHCKREFPHLASVGPTWREFAAVRGEVLGLGRSEWRPAQALLRGWPDQPGHRVVGRWKLSSGLGCGGWTMASSWRWRWAGWFSGRDNKLLA